MTDGKRVAWCHRCHHAIERMGGGITQGRWGHVSDDDWAGPDSECQCTWDLLACSPRTARSRGRRAAPRMGGFVAGPAIYDEVPLLSERWTVLYDEVRLFSERWTEVPCVPERQRRQP
jgi:hypothetical protein